MKRHWLAGGQSIVERVVSKGDGDRRVSTLKVVELGGESVEMWKCVCVWRVGGFSSEKGTGEWETYRAAFGLHSTVPPPTSL